MKTNFNYIHGAHILVYVMLLTTAGGAFNSYACKAANDQTKNKYTETAVPAGKKNKMPVMNPLQVLTSKFF